MISSPILPDNQWPKKILYTFSLFFSLLVSWVTNGQDNPVRDTTIFVQPEQHYTLSSQKAGAVAVKCEPAP